MNSLFRSVRLQIRLSRRLFSSLNPNPENPNPNPDPNSPAKTLRSTIKSLFREKDIDVLVSEFNKASENPRFRSKIGVYETAIRSLATSGRTDAVERILEHQKLFPAFSSDEGFAVRLIILYGRAAMPDHAAATFHDLRCPRSAISFNALLTAFARAAAAPDRIVALFHEIPSTYPSIVPNVASYNIVIDSLCEKGEFSSALEIVDLMKNSGIAPDLITFNTLLNAFYSKGRFEDGEDIWAKMIENGVDPDIRSFNSKLRGLFKVNRVSDAMKVFDELKEVGIKPDTFTFNAMINGYCKEGNLEGAKKFYIELEESGCDPNHGTASALIPELLKAGELEFAARFCNKSINKNCYLDVGLLQPVVDGLGKEQKLVSDAKKLVRHVRSKSYYGRKALRLPLSCLVV